MRQLIVGLATPKAEAPCIKDRALTRFSLLAAKPLLSQFQLAYHEFYLVFMPFILTGHGIYLVLAPCSLTVIPLD